MNLSVKAKWQRLRFLCWKARNRKKIKAWSEHGEVLGLTTDVVLAEVAYLVRLKISKALNVEIEDVTCKVHYHGKKIIPEIQMKTKAAENLDALRVSEVIESSWRMVKPVLEERLKGLRSRR